MSNDKTKSLSLDCVNCGGKLKIDGSQEIVTCEYCGTSYSVADLLDESDSVRIEKIKYQTYKAVENGKQQLEAEKLKYNIQKDKLKTQQETLKSFKESKFSKVLVIFAVISLLMCIVGFNDNRIFAGIIALIEASLFIVSWLIGMQVIKEKKYNFHVLLAVIAFLLLIPYFYFYNNSNPTNVIDEVYNMSDVAKKFNWTDFELSGLLPQPKSNIGNININSESELNIDVTETSKKEYDAYVNACYEKGFNIECKKKDNSFEAFNENGYKLSLNFDESNNELLINLKKPIEMEEIQWPNIGIAKKLPKPKSNIGYIVSEHSFDFSVYVGETSKAQYDKYVNACSKKGFNIDYSKGDDYFYADNKNGDSLTVKYEGNNVMYISVYNYNYE